MQLLICVCAPKFGQSCVAEMGEDWMSINELKHDAYLYQQEFKHY